MDFETFMVFLEELSQTKSYDLNEMKHHLGEAKPSAMSKVGVSILLNLFVRGSIHLK